MKQRKLYSFKEFTELSPEQRKQLDEQLIRGLFNLGKKAIKGIRGFFGAADEVVPPGGTITPGGVAQGVGETMADYLARLQESIMDIIRNAPGNTTSILYGQWQTIRNFIENPTQENWEAVARIIENAGYRIYPDGDGFGGGSMQSWVQDMGDPAQNEIIDAFWDYIFEIFRGMDDLPWDEWI